MSTINGSATSPGRKNYTLLTFTYGTASAPYWLTEFWNNSFLWWRAFLPSGSSSTRTKLWRAFRRRCDIGAANSLWTTKSRRL